MGHVSRQGRGVVVNSEANVLEIPMDNVVIVQVLHAGQDGTENGDGIALGEATALAEPLKELSADGELEIEIIRRPRLEPFVEFDLFFFNEEKKKR
jgi:hypothetical protein